MSFQKCKRAPKVWMWKTAIACHSYEDGKEPFHCSFRSSYRDFSFSEVPDITRHSPVHFRGERATLKGGSYRGWWKKSILAIAEQREVVLHEVPHNTATIRIIYWLNALPALVWSRKITVLWWSLSVCKNITGEKSEGFEFSVRLSSPIFSPPSIFPTRLWWTGEEQHRPASIQSPALRSLFDLLSSTFALRLSLNPVHLVQSFCFSISPWSLTNESFTPLDEVRSHGEADVEEDAGGCSMVGFKIIFQSSYQCWASYSESVVS